MMRRLAAIAVALLAVPAAAQVDTFGPATANNQALGNASLSSIEAKLTPPLNTTASSWQLAQVMLGKCFVFAIPLTSVSTGNYLNVVLANPAGSGETFVILDRRFSQTTANVLRYQFFTSPGAITGTSRGGANQLTGSALTSALTMTFNTAGTNLTGTNAGEMPIPPNGVENSPITNIRTVPPGNSIGYSMGGTGGVLTAAASFTFTLEGCKV